MFKNFSREGDYEEPDGESLRPPAIPATLIQGYVRIMRPSPFITMAVGCLVMAFCSVTMAEFQQISGHRKGKRTESAPVASASVRSVKEATAPGAKKAELTAPNAKRSERAPDSNPQLTKAPSTEQPKPHKPARLSKKSKKAKLHTAAEPRKDLMYHGILEGPSRYDPRRNFPTAGPPDPQTSELTYEHFQELDRNGDGTIDPVERTFGRLDMDHDLSKRQR